MVSYKDEAMTMYWTMIPVKWEVNWQNICFFFPVVSLQKNKTLLRITLTEIYFSVRVIAQALFSENDAYAKFWRDNKEYYGIFEKRP